MSPELVTLWVVRANGVVVYVSDSEASARKHAVTTAEQHRLVAAEVVTVKNTDAVRFGDVYVPVTVWKDGYQ